MILLSSCSDMRAGLTVFYMFGSANHIWKEKENHMPLWDEVEIIDRAEHLRIRRLKE